MIRTQSFGQLFDMTWKSLEKVLKGKGINAIILESDRALRKFIYEMIPDNCIVGLSNSLCSSALKIRDILLEKGNKVYYCWNGEITNRSLDTFEELPKPEFLLTTAETVTHEGKLINREYSGKAFKSIEFPNNIIAFSDFESLYNKQAEKTLANNSSEIDNSVKGRKITLAVLPILKAS